MLVYINYLQEWPLKSQLDPKEYGPPESAITTKTVEEVIRGFMTVDEVTVSCIIVPLKEWDHSPDIVVF